jgi:hypothetical protein
MCKAVERSQNFSSTFIALFLCSVSMFMHNWTCLFESIVFLTLAQNPEPMQAQFSLNEGVKCLLEWTWSFPSARIKGRWELEISSILMLLHSVNSEKVHVKMICMAIVCLSFSESWTLLQGVPCSIFMMQPDCVSNVFVVGHQARFSWGYYETPLAGQCLTLVGQYQHSGKK